MTPCVTDLRLFRVLWVVVQCGFGEGVESMGEGFRGWFAYICMTGSPLMGETFREVQYDTEVFCFVFFVCPPPKGPVGTKIRALLFLKESIASCIVLHTQCSSRGMLVCFAERTIVFSLFGLGGVPAKPPPPFRPPHLLIFPSG